MAIEDWIRIRGDDNDPAPLQGIGGVGSSGSGAISVTVTQSEPLTVTTSDDLPSALWEAQTAYITGESSYLTQLQTQWKQTHDDLDSGVLDSLWGLVTESVEELLSLGVGAVLLKYGIVLSTGAAVVTGVLISLAAGYGMNALKEAFQDWITKGNALIDAMIAENTALLTATSSVTAYTYRNDVIARHERTITRLLMELDAFKTSAESALGGGGGTESDSDLSDWDSVVSELGTSIDGIEDWLSNVDSVDESNLPVPAPPGLPVPPTSNKLVYLKVIYLVGKYGMTFLTELLKKRRENDTAFSDLVEAVNDLKFNGVRFHTAKGDVIELSGIGTYEESYDDL